MKTNALATISSLAWVLAVSIPQSAQAQIEWRVSVKIIQDNTGQIPCNGDPSDSDCQFNTEEEIRERYEGAYGNDLLVGYGRGYTFNVTEIVEIFLDPDDPAMWPPEGLLLVCTGGERDGKGCATSDDCPDGFCRRNG